MLIDIARSFLVVDQAVPIADPRLAQLAVPAGPALSSGDRDPEAFSGPPQRPTVLDHAARQTQPPSWGQRGITVGHEDLRIEM